MLQQQRDYVLRTVEERGVRLIRLWFTDVLGNLKSFAISPAELENALEDGMSFDGSSIDGFSRVQESDVLAIPDANTFVMLPWADSDAPEARVFCDIHNLDGSPFSGDPRQVLRRNLNKARALGLDFLIAPDIEFFYFAPPEDGRPPRPLDEAISSAGGVRFEALSPALMTRMPGVFCAGEMLDWEAPTGGYLLHACLATGHRAGDGAHRFLADRALPRP